ncbi:Cohesin subunit SA-1, putative [Pediculus humanus corporis]|uniref:Cohesin subunit SA-1, putative n=1 Tax=Pediculus humanus subsp. corporis TaxID=121224 RepID=E0VQR7_PEDHC|nr:Cohesin subunit SA-1, putative [Pediculus humanus corporis]EEB15722.1 Cohesin subunit SA-1, putative [Pediculus humanus corporis]
MIRRAVGGKRIRLDDPIPPEYENPQTPMTPAGQENEMDVHESWYGRFYITNPSTPQNNSTEIFNEADYDRDNSYDQNDHDQSNDLGQIDYENPSTPVPRRVTRARARGVQNPPPIPPIKIQSLKRAMEDDLSPEPKRPARKKRAQYSGGGSRNEETSLYYIIMHSKSSLQGTVDEWIENYKVNKDDALLALMQFFINAAGCKGKITPEMHKWEHAAIIRKMTEEFDESSGEYPLISAGQQWKKFKSQFTEFVQILVKQCQYSIIYDQYLMDNVISLLTGLSDSQVRAFRHTATLAAMKLMTALVDVALTVSVNTDNTLRQYEAERQKAQNKRATDRLESLLLKRTELDENMDEIKNMLTYMFKSVFVHRYRDTLPEIRAICMTEIGIWMRKFHTNFLDDSYLKYIGWTLHDRVGEVRLKCLQALIPLYESEELKNKLELFTSKFKDRIVSMTLDRDYDVAVQAVRLVISILKHHRDILTDKDCEHVYELVYSSHRAVAQAAGEFLNERLFTPDEESNAIVRTKRGKKRSPNTPLIRDLVQFFIESELHEHGAYLVDSLIDSNAMVKDWECMTDLLLEDPGPTEEALDNRQETSLIEIMVCAIKQSATGEPPVGRGSTRKLLSQKEFKAIQEDKQKLTSHFIITLPILLDKFSSDPEKLANLLYIPQHFDLELYTKSRQEANLDSLLLKISKIIEKHEDTDVLETAAKTLEKLCYESHVNYTKCQTSRCTMIESIVTKYKEAIDEWNSLIAAHDDVPNDDEIFNIESSLKKIEIFYSCHDLGKWELWDMLYKDVVDCSKNEMKLPERAMKSCIGATFFALQWELSHIEEILSGGGTAEREISLLRLRLNEYMGTMKEIILNSESELFQEDAYNVICDFLIIFCERLGSNPSLSCLIYQADRQLQELLNNFIQKYVFVAEEDATQDEHSKIEDLHKKRNFLASFCKLIVYNIIPVQCGSDVFKHYVKYYNQFGDIIKHTVGKTREINKTSCAITMVNSLITLFQQLQRENSKINKQSEEYLNIKELAKRFALSFGLDAIRNREAITVLHRDGIRFAVNPLENIDDPTGPPPNILFLDIISEFTNKLLKQDKRLVLQFLDRKIHTGMPSSRGEDWQPLVSYRNTLIQGEADQPPTTSRRAYKARKKDLEEEHVEDED